MPQCDYLDCRHHTEEDSEDSAGREKLKEDKNGLSVEMLHTVKHGGGGTVVWDLDTLESLSGP